jgi:hypothetical protein
VQADLADAAGLDEQYDAVVTNVVFQAIPDLVPALRTCAWALKPGGLLVFSLEHPCFEDGTVSWREHGCVPVREYRHEYERPGPHGTDFHRTAASLEREVGSGYEDHQSG